MKLYPMSWEYLAGFFDGEGCITIYDYKHKRTFKDRPPKNQPYIMRERFVKINIDQKIRFFVLMYQRKKTILKEIHEFLNKQGIQNSLLKPKNACWKIQMSSRNAVKKFLNNIFPYLRVKKEKAKFALEFLSGIEKEVKVY